MLLSVTAEYNESPLVKMISIEEETGDVGISYVDSSDGEKLKELYELQESSFSFADFQIIKTKEEDTKDAYELRHFCTNRAPGEPDLDSDGQVIKETPSFLGFLRKMVAEQGSIVMPPRYDEEFTDEGDIPHWKVINASTLQFTDDMGIKASHLIPGSEEGVWRWTSSSILHASHRDEYSDVTTHRFLCLTEFDSGIYGPFMKEHPSRRVVQENGSTIVYRVFSVTRDLPVYSAKTNVMVTPSIMSRLKFVADSYKLALYSLTPGLFADKVIETVPRTGSKPLVTGRTLKLGQSTPVTKKTANAMADYLLATLGGGEGLVSEAEFLKQYPHYQVYSAIFKSQVAIFHGSTQRKKMRAYRALKNEEAYFNLLLQECKHHVMFDNDAYLFNLWTSTNSFHSDIPNYKIELSGGGGTWLPKDSFYW